ncbi:MAG: dienelactone hydrolase family protein [Fimbriimonadaceae bacterium]
MRKLLIAIVGLAAMQAVGQNIVTKLVTYKSGDVELEAYMAYDMSAKGKRPAVLVVHDWNSIDDYERGRVVQLAEMGYVAFAVDIYGKGIRPKNREESAAQAGKYRGNRTLLRERVVAGLTELKKSPLVDTSKIAAIGYCFGGTTVLELARAGADVKGVVSFHGGLSSPTPADAKNIKAKILVCHGADDPGVPPAEVAGFEKEMRDAKVDYTLIAYSGAVHSFTEPSAGNDPSKGSAYHPLADKRSWEHMKVFFTELFR